MNIAEVHNSRPLTVVEITKHPLTMVEITGRPLTTVEITVDFIIG